MGSETAASQSRLPKIDFSDVNPAKPGTRSWDAVRARVMQAMESYGCFEAVYPRVSSDFRDSLFGTALKELFALPLEPKLQNVSDKPFHGYLGQRFPTSLMRAWPSWTRFPTVPRASPVSYGPMETPPFGTPRTRIYTYVFLSFFSVNCETVQSFSEQVMELEETIRKDGFGESKYCLAPTESTRFLFSVSEYGAPQGVEEKKLGLVPHADKNTLALVCQNQVDGLEMETKDGEWIPVTPSPASFVVFAGMPSGYDTFLSLFPRISGFCVGVV
ncbi:putative 2-oxoglutarate-dependent dioxygenase AOP1.2 [Cocos nucifera]|uniref:Putative 2-oxoglutarate-dependent dioxygenase AOP1.2 n=1 Tax=Cocos nucifera TaxID=13894 RepID=A0A8K0IB06_COCNU|nr:putative 2-oxoglutarate-dependent dioxygenase AOP1.2 [Cocos nucifera]